MADDSKLWAEYDRCMRTGGHRWKPMWENSSFDICVKCGMVREREE